MAPSSRGERYHIAELLRKGSFGTAHVVIDNQTRQKHVLKRIRLACLNERQRQSSFQEMDLVSALSHPYVVPYVDGWVHHGHTIHIVYGYCSKGDLGELMHQRKNKLFGEDQLKKWLPQILLAMEYMHKWGVIHRDIKSGNLFLTGNGDINIRDFGLATVRDSSHEPDYLVVGTPHYMSPEMLSGKEYDSPTDIWSLGCIIYELTALKTPFNAFNLPGLVQEICKNTVAPLPRKYSSDWCQLVYSMLKKSPNKRPSVKDLLNCPCMSGAVQDAIQRARRIDPNVVLSVLNSSVPAHWRDLSGTFGAHSVERPTQDALAVPSRIEADAHRQEFGMKPGQELEVEEQDSNHPSDDKSLHGYDSNPKLDSTPLDTSDSSAEIYGSIYHDQYTDRNERGGVKDEGLGVVPETDDTILGPATTSGSQTCQRDAIPAPRTDISMTSTPREGLASIDSAKLSALICGSGQVDTQKRWEVLEQCMTLCAELHRRGRWEEMGHIQYNLSRGGDGHAPQDPKLCPYSRDSDESSPFVLGDKVVMGSCKQCHGVIRYYGPVVFSRDDWVGLELGMPDGKHNGTVSGIPYFACPDMCGLFVRASMLRPEG